MTVATVLAFVATLVVAFAAGYGANAWTEEHPRYSPFAQIVVVACVMAAWALR